ncbi:MAG: glycosyltransferase [Fidelibacterota bacterium]
MFESVYQFIVTSSLLIIFANFLNNLRILSKQTVIKAKSGNFPLISVLIPARNEEKKIARCLESLLAQDYPNYEIVVLDDNSTDRTWEIVKSFSSSHPNLRLIKGKPLPPEWTGKNYACYQLVLAAEGEWFLFTDADTVHAPNSVSVAFASAIFNQCDVLSLLPKCPTETLSEDIFLPLINFSFLAFLPLGLINKIKDPRVSALLGPFIFIRRDFYLKIGGHEAVKGQILDDLQLAQLAKREGGKIVLIDGKSLVSVRFYHGFREIWSGFSKNAFGALGNSLSILFGFMLFNISIFILPYYFLYQGIISSNYINSPLIQVIIISSIRLVQAEKYESSLWKALLHPFSIAMGALISLNSARLTFLKGAVEWKERYYPVQ